MLVKSLKVAKMCNQITKENVNITLLNSVAEFKITQYLTVSLWGGTKWRDKLSEGLDHNGCIYDTVLFPVPGSYV